MVLRREFLCVIGIFLLISGCSADQKSAADAPRPAAFSEFYPRLYRAVFRRNADSLLAFTSDSSELIRAQAWRAIAQTPVDSVSRLIKKVTDDGSQQAWFALSMHELSPSQLRNLEQRWLDHLNKRKGINLVLGRQGDAKSLAFLLSQLPRFSNSPSENSGALAVSRLLIQYPLKKSQQKAIIDATFLAKNDTTIRNWLYGFYRGPNHQLSSALKDTLQRKWQKFGVGKSATVDQYIAKILSPAVFTKIINHYNGDLKNYVQLGVELAKSVDEVSLDSSTRKAIIILLRQPNPHVVNQTLVSLSGKIAPNDSLFFYIKSNILEENSTADVVWLQALNTLTEVDSGMISNYGKRLNKISKNKPYLYPEVLKVRMRSEKPDAFLQRIQDVVGEKGHLKSMYAVSALNEFWSQKENQKSAYKNQIRSIIFEALSRHDRGVAYVSESLIEDSTLFSKSDFTRINSSLSEFRLPGDVEVYQAFGSLYKKRFPEQAKPVIDSLAALNYTPLNRSLKQADWDVKVPESSPKKFRIPGWDRLAELGPHPVWVLETKKGAIKVKMNPLSAPATVSAIDSLTRSGTYDGVPFHRVVPNFVIQGGDIERQDGFGGPDFVIPTEPSEQEFVRGAAGIASAGTDTEGSQYFFVNQWAPHLDGHYTLFGHVIEGMDVVDQIIEGDTVQKAYWK